ncbi:ABC transporter permease [Neobacillus sp. 114]|uniref:ABC transporter permease n=1 Tax=Neobacillus sp. 114 TaxID=3048535 RepID=UPI0024C30230|nr:ABC transporter permease [Neobacillus sp. 114]
MTKRGKLMPFITGVSIIYILLPMLVIIPASFTQASFPSFPPQGFSIQWYTKLLQRPEYIEGFYISIKFALLTALFSIVLGTLGALALAKYNLPGKAFIVSFLTAPLSVPQLVLGVSLLIYFTPLALSGTSLGLFLGHLIISVPYVIRLALTGLSGFDYTLERAAMILGANPFHVFRKITLPLITPAILSGGMFSFLTSFDNVTVSLFLTSGEVTTLPIMVFQHMQDTYDPLTASISTVVVLISVILIVILEKIHGVGRFFGSAH